MKRVGYLYEKMCDIDTVKRAIRNAAKGKNNRPYIAKILGDIDYYAQEILNMLQTENVQLSPNTYQNIFDTSCMKYRLITVPRFYPDQIIHWLVVMAIQPVLERGMYRYCCGSIPNRGGIDAKAFVETAIQDGKMRYVAKLDISKFFNSVNPTILLSMFERKIKDRKMLSLIEKVLRNGGDCLPIGYYTSQWFSNFFLEGLDHYIKEQLHIKYYVRYVDDMVLIDSNKRKLHKAVKAINEYLHTIGLSLKSTWQVWKLHSRPIDFVGYRFYKHRTVLRKKIFFRLCRRIRKVKRTGRISPHQAMSILSLLGWLSHIKARGWYKKKIYPYAPKNKLKRIVSNHSKKLNGGLHYGKGIQQRQVAGIG